MKRAVTFMGRGLLTAVLFAVCAAGAAGTGGCGSGATGGSEAGNPSRSVVGALATVEAAALSVDQASAAASTDTGCPADTIVAIDSRKQEQSVKLEPDCTFALNLFFNKAYSIRFRLEGVDVGGMLFQNSPDRFPAPVMEVSEQETELALGLIVVNDGQSKPESEPAAQNDADLDGIPDYEDPDDDNDGILDVDEPDCDLDGIIDDFDDDNMKCPLVGSVPDNKILEVLPRNGSGIDTPQESVLTDVGIQARFSCELDIGSVGAETFLVTAQDAPDNFLKCDLTLSDSNTSATCLPEGLVPDTIYKAKIQSVRCSDGSAIASTSWTWKTAPVVSAGGA
ncbi:MAG TPA: hypothetical protein VFX30_10255, partial [bacterium]|nr:hypothetical protein [bacterium]